MENEFLLRKWKGRRLSIVKPPLILHVLRAVPFCVACLLFTVIPYRVIVGIYEMNDSRVSTSTYFELCIGMVYPGTYRSISMLH